MEFRNSVFDTCRNDNRAVRDRPRRHRAYDRCRKTRVAGAVFARCGACRTRSRDDLSRRREDVGADLGRATRDSRATARRRVATQSCLEPRRPEARRYCHQARRAEPTFAGAGRAFSGSRAMSVEPGSQLAVALHYDKVGAPRVVAKGRGSIGERILEVARAHDIPIEQNEVLAGALSNVELGDEIPAELYKAVAEVLIFVLQLSGQPR